MAHSAIAQLRPVSVLVTSATAAQSTAEHTADHMTGSPPSTSCPERQAGSQGARNVKKAPSAFGHAQAPTVGGATGRPQLVKMFVEQ
eukprot:360180-Chlamydomonas_euryale.AAC.5